MNPGRLVGVDVGGTFTDVVAIDGGRLTTVKVPTDPQASERSVLRGAAEAGVAGARAFNLASTAGLNALITRSTPKVAFLATMGHRDVLDRGRLWRPFEALTDPSWRRAFGDTARPLVPRYLRRGIRERLTPEGRVLVALDEDQVAEELAILAKCGVEGVAICLMHAWVNPVHELRLRELVLDQIGTIACSISSEVSPLAKEYPRASTTLVDLLMKLKYADYTARLEQGLEELGFEGEFNYADCASMLMPSSYAMESPYRLVVGGPAAGTVASAHFGSFIGKSNLLCGDVGGTSCDISVVLDGQPWLNSTFEIEWDLVVSALSTEIVTLGAGGGSIVAVGRAGELAVGPESAGANPGPACYGGGGTNPTLTDAALLIGILTPDRFLGGRMPLDEQRALWAFENLDTSLGFSDRISYAWRIGLHNIAEGLLDLTIRRGIDPRDFSLVAFGAAGPMILPSLLDLLPLESVIVPPNPGTFSALGLLSADQVYLQTRTLYGVLEPELAPRLSELFLAMERGLIARAGVKQTEVKVVRTFDGRLQGQGFETPFIPVPAGPLDATSIAQMVGAFHAEYEKRNGTRFEVFSVEGVTYRVQVIVPSEKVAYPRIGARGIAALAPAGQVTLHHLHDGAKADCYDRADLLATDHIDGPAIIWEEMATTYIPDGRSATVGHHGEVVIV